MIFALKFFYTVTIRWNNSTPASWQSGRANMELWQIVPNHKGYVNTGSCKSVQLNTHAEERLTECHSQLTEKRRSQDRTGEHQGYANCRHNLNSSPRGPSSPNLRLFVSLPNRMKISVHQTRAKHIKTMSLADSNHPKF